MTPPRVRVRRLALALATGVCLLVSTLPAAAGDKGRGNGHGHGNAGTPPGHSDDHGGGPPAAQQPAVSAPQTAPSPRRQSGGRGIRAKQNGGGKGRDGGSGGGSGPATSDGSGGGTSAGGGNGNAKAKGRTQNSGGGSSSGSGTSSGGGASTGSSGTSGTATGSSGSTGGSSSAAPAPGGGQPATGPTRGSGGSDRSGRTRQRSAAGGERRGSGAAPAPRTPAAGGGEPLLAGAPAGALVPAPVIVGSDAGATVAPLGPVGPVALEGDAAQRAAEGEAGAATGFRSDDDSLPPVTQTVERIVEVVPAPVKAALAALALIAVLFAVQSFLAGARARRLARQREQLLDEVGLLQAALLPTVPSRLGDLVSTVAYRPADGPAAGGDFYDAFVFDGGKVGVIVGDVSGHGREALARTALMRYTLRAYLDAGLEPRAALKVAGSVLDDDLGSDFATVVVAVYDADGGTLTYASAGHPPPILLGPPAHEPATSSSSPPIGVGATTGLRQTTVGLPPGSIVCFYTDGMTDARLDGELLGRERLAELLAELGPDATAPQLLDRVSELADRTPDDMAACILHARGDGRGTLRVEELEVSRRDLAGDTVPRFLRECGIPVADMPPIFCEATDVARAAGTAVLRVRLGDWRPGVDVLPANVETITAAVRRRASIAKSS